MIRIEALHKSYHKGSVHALRGITLHAQEGEILGIIGPDGAGKSTLFRIVASLLLPDSGTVLLNGLNVVEHYRKVRSLIGYMPGRFSLYEDLTVEENLNFFATIYRTTIEQNYHLIKDIYQQIEPFKQRRAGNLSGGMKQKLALSCALIHRPLVLILDEPTTGVDPVSRREFWDILLRLKSSGITILVSTPYMDEATKCSRVAFISEGKILQANTPSNILAHYPQTLWAVEGGNVPSLLKRLRTLPYVHSSFAFGDKLHITVEPHTSPQALQALLGADVKVYPIQPTIEDAFMALTTTSP